MAGGVLLAEDPFLASTVTSLLALGWHTRGKYRPLASMVRLLGAAHFLRREPSLPTTMLGMISDQTLACYVSASPTGSFTTSPCDSSVYSFS
jgi:hypothetical protein